MHIHGFAAWRPLPEVAAAVASVPYDTVNREEAKALAEGNPSSFLYVVRPEIGLPDDVDAHDDQVYDEALAAMERLLADGTLIVDQDRAVFLYRLKMGTHVQRGIVACCNAADYQQGRILRHEKTRKDKEDDRTRHVKTLRAHTGPVFLTYRDDARVDALVAATEQQEPLYRVSAPDGVLHEIWKIADPTPYVEAFAGVNRLYIADGHHRAAAAVRAAEELGQAGQEKGLEYSRFLAVLFPAGQLKVLGYHRVLSDLNGMDPAGFLARLQTMFRVQAVQDAFEPKEAGSVGMYLAGQWYSLQWDVPQEGDPVARLDVSVLQERVLGPLLGIADPRTSERIAFIGGIRGTRSLEQEVAAGRAAVAFAMCPVAVESVMDIAEAGREMPPKSTWFEPKLRSGLLVHPFDV